MLSLHTVFFSCSPITLVVAKCWDPNPKGYFTLSRQEPVRPIDPRAWVLHTNAMTANDGRNVPGSSVMGIPTVSSGFPGGTQPSVSAGGGGGGGGAGTSLGGGLPILPEQLTLSTDMAIVVRAMLAPDSGLAIHDRTWLKITIPNAVIETIFLNGALLLDLTKWLGPRESAFWGLVCHCLPLDPLSEVINHLCYVVRFAWLTGHCLHQSRYVPGGRIGPDYSPLTTVSQSKKQATN
ncbi:unnamed protein product [Schistocephalus solidus]|uniref:DUF4457 domain-containing protein n=1 Tax=Schistocephalus solidus TaxID=70667 RepID=A0A183TMM3_SCHSO|nr:unnamed protein product [Schistocephalus solidus]